MYIIITLVYECQCKVYAKVSTVQGASVSLPHVYF